MSILYYLLLFRKIHCQPITRIMKNCRRQGNRIAFVPWTFVMLASLPPLCLRSVCHAHLIQIDHDEFRTSGFPRPHLPPPVDQSAQPLYAAKELTPVELMVDLTNDLTYRILHYHSILNRNNFAYSPCSLMSVLVALYEGSAGRSATELRNVLQLPNNRDVIRIGYRDIHRRLRTYFFGSENPLKGLSLNKENVTITRSYETILKFYGYDLGLDMVSSTAIPTTTTAIPTTLKSPTAVDTVILMATTTTTPVEITTTSVKTTTTPIIITTSTEKPTEPTTLTLETTEEATDTTTESNTPAAPETSTTAAMTEATTEAGAVATPAADEDDNEAEKKDEAAELVSSFVAEEAAEPFLRIQKARVSRLPSAKLQAPPVAATLRAKYLPSARRLSRHKRHLLNIKEMDSNLFITLFNAEHTHQSLFPIPGPQTETVVVHNPYEADVDSHFLRSSVGTKQNYNTDVISHVFYLGHQQLIHTTFKVYNAVLYFKYFDHLKMSVLELELDTPEYNLMILLPDYQTELVSAAASLKSGPTLRLMRKQLKPRWVQAIIPDFELHGTMFLTNDLQNMGICDIFEPNLADLHPMTNENRIYVKHIEQSINVNIRTHPINQLKRNYGTQTQPIQISVSHPFLFFIIDRDLDVAVMAGRILNPQNVRIQ